MPPRLRTAFIVALVALLFGGPWAYSRFREHRARNFHVVEKGVLYRSGQLPLAGLQRIVHDFNIRTIISLREGERDDDPNEVKFCKRWGLHHVRITPRSWWASQGPPPAEEGLKAFRAVMDDPKNHPVLIHCFAGVHRTGAYCAVYRMDYQGWRNQEALAEMKRIGYRTLESDWDLLTYLESYQPQTRHELRTVSRTKTSPP